MGSSRKHPDEILADSFRSKATNVGEHEGDKIGPAWDQKTARIGEFDYYLV